MSRYADGDGRRRQDGIAIIHVPRSQIARPLHSSASTTSLARCWRNLQASEHHVTIPGLHLLVTEVDRGRSRPKLSRPKYLRSLSSLRDLVVFCLQALHESTQRAASHSLYQRRERGMEGVPRQCQAPRGAGYLGVCNLLDQPPSTSPFEARDVGGIHCPRVISTSSGKRGKVRLVVKSRFGSVHLILLQLPQETFVRVCRFFGGKLLSHYAKLSSRKLPGTLTLSPPCHR